ncbi:MAG: methyltransferase domain-containing protein, partial [Lamprobacter sp.]|uniref:class I SAM-dependent methyltransferase n=1 Tax=Lamprobacter sp. TaxID=3100796 RepID=UPI002B25C37E
FLQDIAPGMVKFCRNRLNGAKPSLEFSIGNAGFLPYPDNYFDAVYSFGALGEFADIQRSLTEMARVTKIGGRIAVGDESMPPWLRQTDFAKILATTNPQFLAELPLQQLPVSARQVHLRWLIGGVFYFIDFTVGDGEPTAKFDLEIPGPRGGTLRTRYQGQLEGVTSEAKALAQKAIAKRGVSMHRWLDDVVRAAAARDLEE